MARNGYGVIGVLPRGKIARVHRVSWELAYGPIPDRLQVCHHCDVRHCVRPDHLFLGTATDNMRDAARKNRMSRTHNPPGKNRGSMHGMSKLTEAQVLAIRSRHANNESQAALSREYGITSGTTNMIVKRKRWTHI